MKARTSTKRLLTLIAALVLPLALVGAATANAAPSGTPTAFHVEGAGAGVSSKTIDTRTVGTTVIQHVSAEVEFTGDITATGTELFTAIIEANSNVHFHGYGVFAGTVGGRNGTFEYHFTGTTAGGRIVFDSGMDQLKGMKGHIRWTSTTQGAFSYEGGVRFPS
ncbi:MAG TPA: DUF3224 domain-containing protein [Jatrophihabitans sp.]|nr:DUF3224 domain-containing protein [Jatrophihabitans sp.]